MSYCDVCSDPILSCRCGGVRPNYADPKYTAAAAIPPSQRVEPKEIPLCHDCKGKIEGDMYVGPHYEMQCESCHEYDVAHEVKPDKPGYHLRHIEKGVLGEPSKIKEEVEEFLDACDQGVAVMALVELSDLLGAISAYLEKHHPSMSLDDLQKMRAVTERAFRNGRR